jgi:hypothetical protein
MRPLLGNPGLRPVQDDILAAQAHLLEALAIRKSSPLFRLRTGADVQERLRFYNTGPAQLPGLIAFGLSDQDGSVDPRFSLVVVLLNAAPEAQTLKLPELAGGKLKLHPIQAGSADPVVRTAAFDGANGTFTVPARTAAVFVAFRGQ